MAKLSTQLKYLRLMEDLEWDGVNNWTDIKTEVSSAGILRFKAWLRGRLDVIWPEKTRECAREYYFGEGNVEKSSGEYMYLQQARSALYAAYKVEREFNGR